MRALMTVLLLSWSLPAHATWSIVAVDPVTREVGVAGATCGPGVWMIAGLAPGDGAVAAQGSTNPVAQQEALRLLQRGWSPAEILDAIHRAPFDNDDTSRQYGVVSLHAPAAAFHGSALSDWYGAATDEHVTVQGNILVGPEVVQAAHAAFRDAVREPLAERLLRALEAGAAHGGDSRCPPGDAAKSAFLFVASPADPALRPRVDLKVDKSVTGGNPVDELRRLYGLQDVGWSCAQSGPAAWAGLLGWMAAAWRLRRKG